MEKEQMIEKLLIELENETELNGEITIFPMKLTKAVVIFDKKITHVTNAQSSCIKSKLSGDRIYFCISLRRFLFEGYISEISKEKKVCIVFSGKVLDKTFQNLLKWVAFYMTPCSIKRGKKPTAETSISPV